MVQYTNDPSMVYFGNDYLEQPTQQSLAVNAEKNRLSSVNFPNTQDGQYLKWAEQNKSDYGNFMNNTLSPQNNPYGINGNPDAMRYLEQQKPRRGTTSSNPFMNVPITDYDKPQLYSKSEGVCGPKCQKNFYKSLFQSPEDALWSKSSSERQFYTTPNTSVPNEQNKYAQWLYGNNQVGKSGSIYDRYGYPYTADSLVNTGVNAASPQGAGQVETNFGTPFVQGASPWVNNPNYGHGFGGIQGGVPYPTMVPSSPAMMTSPYPLVAPPRNPVPYQQQGERAPPQSQKRR
jgi:hypothetical protein